MREQMAKNDKEDRILNPHRYCKHNFIKLDYSDLEKFEGKKIESKDWQCPKCGLIVFDSKNIPSEMLCSVMVE